MFKKIKLPTLPTRISKTAIENRHNGSSIRLALAIVAETEVARGGTVAADSATFPDRFSGMGRECPKSTTTASLT
jgi:hypothetical protein